MRGKVSIVLGMNVSRCACQMCYEYFSVMTAFQLAVTTRHKGMGNSALTHDHQCCPAREWMTAVSI